MQAARSFTEGSISSGLLRFALPILFANILQSLNGSVNSIWVGRFLGEAALTATSNANTVMFLLIATAFGIAMAATILIAQHIGARNLAETKRIVGTSASFFAAISVVMAIAGLVLSRPLLIAMQTPPDALALAVAYMRVIFLALPCLYMYAFVMSVLRGAGDSTTPFFFMLLSVTIDILLNPVFIFGVGPVPRLGIAGSALATFISQAISLSALIHHLYRRKHMLVLHRRELRLLRVDWPIIAALIRKGIPLSAQMLVVSLSAILMVSIVNRLGVDTAAAFGASLQLWNYIQMPAFAVGMAVSSMAAQNVGAGKWDRVSAIARVGVWYSLALTGSVVLLLQVLDSHAYALFLKGQSAAMLAAHPLNRIATSSFVFFGISLTLFGVVRAAGAVIAPLVCLILALLLVRIPLAGVLLGHFGAQGLWWSFPLSSALGALLAWLYYRYGGWRSAYAPLRPGTRAAACAAPTATGRAP